MSIRLLNYSEIFHAFINYLYKFCYKLYNIEYLLRVHARIYMSGYLYVDLQEFSIGKLAIH